MMLMPKQESFCLKYLETGNASEAYRFAYDASRMKPTTVNRTAKELLDNPKIAARLAELRKPVIEKAQMTLEQHLDDLKRLRDSAWASEKYGPAIQAEIARGKASGYYIERVEKGNPGDFDKLDDKELDIEIDKTQRAIDETTRAIERARTQAKASAADTGKAKAAEGKSASKLPAK